MEPDIYMYLTTILVLILTTPSSFDDHVYIISESLLFFFQTRDFNATFMLKNTKFIGRNPKAIQVFKFYKRIFHMRLINDLHVTDRSTDLYIHLFCEVGYYWSILAVKTI